MPELLKNVSQVIDRKYLHLSIIAIAVVVMNWAVYTRLGIRQLVDGRRFLEMADLLLSTGQFDKPTSYFYSFYISIIAFCQWIGFDATSGTISFQIVLNAISLIALYKASQHLFKHSFIPFITVLLYILWWEHMQWNFDLMTESIFRSLSCFLLYFLALYPRNRKSIIGIVAILFLLLLTRPTAIIIVIGVIAFIASVHKGWFSKKHLFVRIGFVALALILGLACANMMFGMWDFTRSFQTGNIITYMDLLEGNSLYYADLRITPPADLSYCEACSVPIVAAGYFYWNNLGYVTELGIYKVWHLLSGLRPYYSNLHNWVLGLWMLMIYCTFLVGCLKVKCKEWIVFALTLVLVNCGVVVISGVDWDNRFYIPMESGIVVLAGFGAGKLMRECINYFFNSGDEA